MSSTTRIELLGKDNYDSWKIQATALLVENDLWELVSGETPRPAAVPENDTMVKAWDKADRKALAKIILAIHPSQVKQIKSHTTSRELWLKLEGMYQSKGPAKKAHLLKRLTLLKMREGDDIREHINSFTDIVEKLQEMDVTFDPEHLCITLLYSLPDNFEMFRCAMETRDKLPDLETLKIKILEESEAHGEAGNQVSNAMIASGKRHKNSWRTAKKNHPKNEKKEERKENPKVKCFRCNKLGHKAPECRKGASEKDKSTDEAEKIGLFVQKTDELNLAFQAEKDVSGDIWCLDSGCTTHMCNDQRKFKKLKKISHQSVKLASSALATIEGEGNVTITSSNGTNQVTIDIEDVLNVPDLRINLLSVSRIISKGYRVMFSHNCARILDNNGNTKLMAEHRNGLYYVIEKKQLAATAEIKPKASNIMEWHLKLGHLNEGSLHELARKEAATGIQISSEEKLLPCEICAMGKLSQTPFNKESVRNTEILEIIHTDVCGPMRVKSIGGARFFVVFIDDKTRWCEVRFIKHKSDVLKAFQEVKNLMENLTERKIKYLQSDNGKEYCNEDFDRYLKQCGISRRLTVPYTPEQNGVAERRNRTLVEMARCLMIQSGLAASFWAEAISTANYLRNRCPSKPLNGITAFEKWHKRRPDIRHLKVFGTRAFILDKALGKDKFAPRSREGIFLGYSQESKGYRIWSMDKRRVEISRDVRFLPDYPKGNDFEEFLEEDVQGNTLENIDVSENSQRMETDIRVDEELIQVPNEIPDNVEARENDYDELEEQVPNLEFRRGQGRPRIVRTGQRGRPRKEYHLRYHGRDEDPEVCIEEEEDGRRNEEIEAIEETANLVDISVKEALSGPEAVEWTYAIGEEVKALLKNNTWDIIDRPPKQNVISCRFVLRNKLEDDGTIKRRKARLVARGFAQRHGIEFTETYAPVARMNSIRILTALSASLGLEMHQLDVSTAYLNGEIEEQVYMEIPKLPKKVLERIASESEQKGESHLLSKVLEMQRGIAEGNKACLLNKAIYGLRQSGRQWNLRFDEEIRKLGLIRTNADPCIYFDRKDDLLTVLAIYVDDIIIASKNRDRIIEIKSSLMSSFEMKDLGKIKRCLGIEFVKTENGIAMSQSHYVQEILERFGMENAKPVATPCDPSVKLTRSTNATEASMGRYPYQELIGSLMYLAVCTRPDVSFVVSSLSQFNTCYSDEHWTAAKRVLRYLKGTASLGIHFSNKLSDLQGFADADWGSCSEDRRSYSGFVFTMGNGPVSWESKKQRTVALSTTEAEYMALTEATKESIHIARFLNEIGIRKRSPVPILNDNQGAQKLAKNPLFHSRTKHIDIRHHFIREAVKNGDVELRYLATEEMPADVLTKGLPRAKHEFCLDRMCIKIVNESKGRLD